MKRKFIFALFIVLAIACLPAFAAGEPFTVEIKGQVHPDLGEFIFTLDCYEDEYEYRTKTITIKEAKSGKKIQTLTTSDFSSFGDDAWTFSRDAIELIIEDMNFDGFADIRIVEFIPAGPNIPYICWVWDNVVKQFVHDKDLSDIASLEVDHENKWIECSNRVSANSHCIEYYRYIGGKLTLFKVVDVILDDDGGTTVTRELINGKLTETSREIDK
ncbi:MAG: hypothetical protein FWG09_07440 [Synergistaceae bacterium]|nr:hypothetical protein [Synergistaceae bacterium]